MKIKVTPVLFVTAKVQKSAHLRPGKMKAHNWLLDPCARQVIKQFVKHAGGISEDLKSRPRTQVDKTKNNNKCVPGCKETLYTQTQVVSEEQKCLALGISITPPIPIPTPLCKGHYHTVYNQHRVTVLPVGLS